MADPVEPLNQTDVGCLASRACRRDGGDDDVLAVRALRAASAPARMPQADLGLVRPYSSTSRRQTELATELQMAAGYRRAISRLLASGGVIGSRALLPRRSLRRARRSPGPWRHGAVRRSRAFVSGRRRGTGVIARQCPWRIRIPSRRARRHDVDAHVHHHDPRREHLARDQAGLPAATISISASGCGGQVARLRVEDAHSAMLAQEQDAAACRPRSTATTTTRLRRSRCRPLQDLDRGLGVAGRKPS